MSDAAGGYYGGGVSSLDDAFHGSNAGAGCPTDWNNTKDPFPKHGTVCHKFEPMFSGRAGGGQEEEVSIRNT